MDIINFSNTVLQSNSEDLVEFVAQNRQEIKFMFVNAGTESEVRDEFHSILVYLTELHEIVTPQELYLPEIQFIYFEFGLYFKRCRVHGPVSTCKNKIENPILKARLNAWLHYHFYTDPSSEINFYPDISANFRRQFQMERKIMRMMLFVISTLIIRRP